MKTKWLINEKRDSLILFFAGWGMDERPFERLDSLNSDVLMFHDYRDTDVPVSLSEVCESYQSITLIAWSLGVPIAQQVCNASDVALDVALAVNGTLHPADDQYGIPEAVFDATQDSLSSESLLRFYRRMCVSRQVTEGFMANAPERTIDDLAAELGVLRETRASGSCIYTAALVGNKDRIIPPDNQDNCWERHGVPVHRIDAPHYLFHLYTCWEDLIDAGRNDG